MANADTPRGFWPVRHLTGGLIRANEYAILSTLAENIFKGDMVKLVAGGEIQVAAAGDRVLGAFHGCEYVLTATGAVTFSKYWPTGTTATNIKAYVYDDPNLVYGVQSAGSTVQDDIGNLGDLVAGAGSTTTGLSAFELNGTTTADQATFRVIGKLATPNNAWGTNVNLLVTPYEHEFTVTELSAAPTSVGI